jgi:hypothetical protein
LTRATRGKGLRGKGKERRAKRKEQRGKCEELRGKGKVPTRPHWRFEDLEIWQLACDLAIKFHRLAEELEQRRLYRYAEQLRAAGLSL